LKDVLPQITRDNFFSMKGQGQNFGVGWHNHNKHNYSPVHKAAANISQARQLSGQISSENSMRHIAFPIYPPGHHMHTVISC